MRAALAAVLVILCVSGRAAEAPPPSGLRDLTPGRYELKLSGTLCAACLRAVALELGDYEAVESAAPDVPGEGVRVAVRSGKVLRATAIKSALRRAARLANLGATYEVAAVRYELKPLNPALPPAPKKPSAKK